MIRTSEFSIAPSATAAHLAQQWLWKRWLIFVLPVTGLFVMGLFDWRWALVAMMAIFILWPMALFFVWCGTALAPEAVKSSRPHNIVFDDKGLRIDYLEEESFRSIEPEYIPWNEIKEIEHGSRYVRFMARAGRCILMPVSALDNKDMAMVVELYRHR